MNPSSRPEVQERRDRMHVRSDLKVPAEQQWEADAQGSEHDGAYLEPATCLRRSVKAQTCRVREHEGSEKLAASK